MKRNVSGQIASYDVVNARITWSDIALGETARLQVSAWGRNIFDQEYRENTIPFGLWTISYWGAPATYGLDARVSF
jgi:iron complex outermembrane receptor protein